MVCCGGRIANLAMRQVGTTVPDRIRFAGGASATPQDRVLIGTGLAVIGIDDGAGPAAFVAETDWGMAAGRGRCVARSVRRRAVASLPPVSRRMRLAG